MFAALSDEIMLMDSGIPKRIRMSLESFFQDDLENSLYQISAAIEATAKKRYPNWKPAKRVRRFLNSELDIIYGLSTMNRFTIGPNANIIHAKDNGKDLQLSDIIYQYIRCDLAHEATINKKILLGGQFGVAGIHLEGLSLTRDNGKFLVSRATVMALIFCVVCACENKDININDVIIPFLSQKITISEYKGDKERFISFYTGLFN